MPWRLPAAIGCTSTGSGAATPSRSAARRGRKHSWSRCADCSITAAALRLGEPYTKFTKPRDFHPDDGATITRSRYDVLTNGDQAFEDIAKGDTGEPVKDAWGGYHDAGDWNPRRVSHMTATMAQLELVELFPGYFNALKLNIPPEPGVPDIITEALFEIDCFRRLQLPDGGIPFGIKTNGDPIPGEISWLSCQHAYVLSPNIRDSWHYAAVAARAAKVLKPFKPERAAEYLKSAERAFAWAEADYAKRKANGSLQSLRDVWRAIDNRNLAALVLYDATGDARWHKIFLEDTQLTNSDPETNWYEKWIQCDAAFLYARLAYGKADPAIKRHALVAVEKQARRSLDFASHNAFALTHIDKYRPLFGGFFSTSGGTEFAARPFPDAKAGVPGRRGPLVLVPVGLQSEQHRLHHRAGDESHPASSARRFAQHGPTAAGGTDLVRESRLLEKQRRLLGLASHVHQ